MGAIVIACFARRRWGGDPVKTSWDQRIRSLPDLVPPILLFAVVVGSIYAGVATPTEAASVGVVFALILAAWNRSLSFRMLREAFEGTMRTTAMIMLIILAAVFLNFILGFIGVTQALLQTITDLGPDTARNNDLVDHFLPHPRHVHGNLIHAADHGANCISHRHANGF